MLSIQEHPIHRMQGKCIYPCKDNLQQKKQFHNYNDLYGSENYEQGRFQHLGVPMLLVQIEEEREVVANDRIPHGERRRQARIYRGHSRVFPCRQAFGKTVTY